jgi:hypothetical protein
MRRQAAILALTAAMAPLGGCVYDPYSGAWLPCCNYYGYPYAYRYPAPYYPYGYAYGAPPTAYPGQPSGPPGAAAWATQGGALAQRFAAANVTHDGRLTRAQAQAGMPFVGQNFDAIDFDRKGYVTLPEVQAFAAQQRAAGGYPGQFDAD